MSLFHGFGVCAGIAMAILVAGCRTPQRAAVSAHTLSVKAPVVSFSKRHLSTPEEDESSLDQASYEDDEAPSEDAAGELDDPFAEAAELQLELLVSAVTSRNPSLQAANAAWSAAAERYPQAVAFDDPMMQTMFAPATFSSGSPTQSSYVLGVAQRVPWHGKRALRGQIAEWDATAASWDASEVQLRLEAFSITTSSSAN
jgi:hypothetical protein